MRFMRKSEHLTKNTPIHWMAWLGCTGGVVIVGYLIGSGIPVFNELISLIGAVFATFMSFHPMGCMWFYDNWNRSDRNMKWRLGAAWAAFILIAGTFMVSCIVQLLFTATCPLTLSQMIGGTYGSVLGIINSKERTSPWSCADNSNSKAG